MQAPAPPYVPYADYLAAEAVSETTHEYLAGRVLSMAAGGSPQHPGLAAAITMELGRALRGRPCRVFSSDLRVGVDACDLSTYPDVTVVCGTIETSPRDPDAITNPVVLVEVLSSSTEAWCAPGRGSYLPRPARVSGQTGQRVLRYSSTALRS